MGSLGLSKDGIIQRSVTSFNSFKDGEKEIGKMLLGNQIG
jgi:hypothetical protein